MQNVKKFGLALAMLMLIGSGCVGASVSQTSPDEAAALLHVQPGDEIAIRETVLGIGGPFVKFFKRQDAELTLVIQQWMAGVQAEMNWNRELQQETEDSKKAREAYEAQYANAPIGSELPPKPEPVLETITQSGTLTTKSLADALHVFLPIFWKTDETLGEESSLIWISQKQYDELIQTRRTKINLGLFDDSVSYAVGLTDQVKQLVEKLKGAEETPEGKNVLDVEADIEWGTYDLVVDGIVTTVQTIQAQNAFARYTILANRQNPLILEIMLSPASQGSLHLFSRESIGESFWGYEVVSITHADASTNEDQPQP